jgi:hypothetical protein
MLILAKVLNRPTAPATSPHLSGQDVASAKAEAGSCRVGDPC